nr:O-acetyl-ADP-ribose deacetylase [Wansuia hejianensis]
MMYTYKNTNINIIKGDITEIKVDAIVNAANNTLLGGGGVDGAIHEKGGEVILEQCKKIGGCPTGEARITTAGNLPSKYIIHTVGPIYKGIDSDKEFLYNAYYNSLKLAEQYNLKTVAFPSISTGAYRYPIEEAVVVAINATLEYIDDNNGIEEINFILHSSRDYDVYKQYVESIFK